MKLKEYFAAVAHVLHERRTEGEIFDAITEGKTEAGQPGLILKEFDRAIGEVRAALLNNKKLLGVFDDAENPEPKEKKREREIDEQAMRRHLLKVRRDLSRFAPETSGDPEKIDKITKFEWIVVRIMTEICGQLGGFPELGGIFSKTEALAYRREFEKTEPKPEPKAQSTPTAASTPKTPQMPRPIVASYPKRQVPSAPAVKPPAASISADLSPPTPHAKPSPTLEELTQRAIAARTRSYEEQKAAIDALNEELRKQGKIL
jgi:hypothetical protein